MANTRKAAATDIPAGNWIDRWPPARRPYLRLARIDRPIGIWLLMFPCWWSTALATPAGRTRGCCCCSPWAPRSCAAPAVR